MFCPSCGTQIPDQSRYCFVCGKSPAAGISMSKAIEPEKTKGKQPAPEKQETVLLDERNIKVTNARFVVRGQTYAMSGITSVKIAVERPSQIVPWIMIVASALAVVNGFKNQSPNTVLVAGLLLILGFLWLRSIRPNYEVQLTSASSVLFHERNRHL